MNKKIQQQNVTPSGNRTTGLGFQVQHAPFYTNLTLACNTESLGSCNSHALLILTNLTFACNTESLGSCNGHALLILTG